MTESVVVDSSNTGGYSQSPIKKVLSLKWSLRGRMSTGAGNWSMLVTNKGLFANFS